VVGLLFLVRGESVESCASGSCDATDTAKSLLRGEDGERLFTAKEIAAADGNNAVGPVYVAVLGKVYDVSSNRRVYGKDGMYQHFSGKDGSRAFVTGDWHGAVPDLVGLVPADIKKINGWGEFFAGRYTYVGKMIGHFYSEKGWPTDALLEVFSNLKIAEAESRSYQVEAEKIRGTWVDCSTNVGIEGSRNNAPYRKFWCKNGSVPRSWTPPGADDAVCVCVPVGELREKTDILREYKCWEGSNMGPVCTRNLGESW